MEKTAKPKALAYQVSKRGPYSLKFGLVVLDCLFLGLQPVLVHISKNDRGQYSFHPMAVNFMTEVVKTTYAAIVLLFLGSGRPGPSIFISAHSFATDTHHNRLLLVPAVLYAINNYLKFTMQLFFHPTTTKMLGNFKICFIALLMRAVMRRNFSVIQWEALFLLVAGITVNQLAGNGCATIIPDTSFPITAAVLSTLATCTVPGAASVYNEYALKKHMDTSVHLQNFFLYFFGMMFNLGALLAVSAWRRQGLYAMFAGQSRVTVLLIANNAAQGILSSFFYKFADTILKKYSSTIATIFTALMSWALFGHSLTLNFVLGVSIVFISMHQFFTFGDKPGSPFKGSALVGDTNKGVGLPPLNGASAGVGANLGGLETGRYDSSSNLCGLVHSPSLDHIVTLGGPGNVGDSSRSGPAPSRFGLIMRAEAAGGSSIDQRLSKGGHLGLNGGPVQWVNQQAGPGPGKPGLEQWQGNGGKQTMNGGQPAQWCGQQGAGCWAPGGGDHQPPGTPPLWSSPLQGGPHWGRA